MSPALSLKVLTRSVMVVFMKTAAFWDVTPCCLIDVYRSFRGLCLHHHQDGSKSLRNLSHSYQITQHLLPEGSSLYITQSLWPSFCYHRKNNYYRAGSVTMFQSTLLYKINIHVCVHCKSGMQPEFFIGPWGDWPWGYI